MTTTGLDTRGEPTVPTTSADTAAEELRRRLSPPMPAGLGGWMWPLAVAAVGGVLRFWRLGTPDAFVFDETYYAKDALSLVRYGAERSAVEGADKKILAGNTDVFTGDPSMVVHPPAGKWLIGMGEQIFGADPFGWRVAVALLGTLAVLLLARIVRRMTRSTLIGSLAGLLLALDGLHIVMSRTALLDGILAFWALAAFGALVVDRDHSRDRLASLVGDDPPPGLGPALGLRPWRLLAGLFLGLAVATKWNGLWFVVGFGLLSVLWDVGARRAVGVRRPFRAALLRDAAPAFTSLVIVAAAVYVASWSGWFLSDVGWDRHWAEGRDTAFPMIPEALRSWWHYHAEVYRFHVHLDAYHPYSSSPWSWPVLGRPVSFYYESVKEGQGGCGQGGCAAEVLALGTPALWWAAIVALVHQAWRWITRRDWRAGAVLAGVAAGYLPWFHYADRTIYSFYAVVLSPFLAMAVALSLGTVLGPATSSPSRRWWGAVAVGAYVLVVIANLAYLYPILVGDTIPMDAWNSRMWFRSWI